MSRRPIFVVAILASSFLIFLVQPMVGKRILPWFGGTPSVWSLCLAFYQTTLFLGYAYAHLLIRFARPVVQLGVHTALVAAAFVALPVLPSLAWGSGDLSQPNRDILAMLGSSVALPFAVLASTGPLVQAWFARAVPDRSPYPLYAVSNIGSFAALLAYPFVFEPRLPLSTTGTLWSVAFVAATLATLVCAGIAARSQAMPPVAGATPPEEAPVRLPATTVGLWIALAACAVVLLMGVTNSVCLDIASVPFLWVLPLATYLMTFILCFASDTDYRPVPYVILTLGAFFLTFGMRFPLDAARWLLDAELAAFVTSVSTSLYVQIPAWCALLFGGCMILHGELYRLRPAPRALTAYYLCISGGGALGGLFVGLAAPVLFDDYHETRIGLGLGVALFLSVRALSRDASLRALLAERRWRLGAPLTAVLTLFLLWPPAIDQQVVVHRARGFFGVLTVTETGGETISRQRQLRSGSTLHGVEFLDLGGPRPMPTAYYGPATGVAAVFAHNRHAGPVQVGVIGLGVGALSAYGRPGDSFRFYEIDPAVVHIAVDSGLFSFVGRSRAEVDVVLKDARLAIDQEQRRPGAGAFDLLLLDAFSSDAIPVHLLTVEAFRLYADALTADGVLAAHVTNRHLDLIDLVARAGREVGLEPLVIRTKAAPRLQSQHTDWVVLARRPERIDAIERVMRRRSRFLELPPDHATLRRPRLEELADVPLWTDDYSDLLRVLGSH